MTLSQQPTPAGSGPRGLRRRGTRAALAALVTAGVATAGVAASATPADAATSSSKGGSGLFSALWNGTGIWGDSTADGVSRGSGGKNAADADPGSLYTIEKAIGARSVWEQRDSSGRQITGQGVGVAVLDSGVSPVAGLNGSGKLVDGPDLSIEGNGPLTDVDTFGHGTHMAGIIGVRDAADLGSANSISKLSPATQLGVAPDSTIEALKLGTADGSVDVSQVIAALNWVTEHQTLPNGQKIRVVNLSYGTDSVQAYQSDPLAAAAENAWKHGVVVVVSGGNEGPTANRLTDPAMDPYVLSVGASDGNDTVAGWKKPTVADFSSSGTAQRHVDLVAPGRSIVSLRDPGSTVDVLHPEGRVAGDTTGRLFRGSGTSQAAAVVSGAVALLLQAYPQLTPDQVKYVLTHSADQMNVSPTLAGAGELDIAQALKDAASDTSSVGKLLGTLNHAPQTFPASTGSGSIEAARAGADLVDADGNVLSGEVDVQGDTWDPKAWWAAASSLKSWSGGNWNGAAWTGSGWGAGAAPVTTRWDGHRWSGHRWSDANWDAANWTSANWDAHRWSAAAWDAHRWSSSNWN